MTHHHTILIWALLALLLPAIPSCGSTPSAESSAVTGQSAATTAESASSAEAAPEPAKVADFADWPDHPPLGQSAMGGGIIGTLLNKLPPALVVNDALLQPGDTAQITILLGRGVGSTVVEKYPDRTLIIARPDGTEVARLKTNSEGMAVFERKFTDPGNEFFVVSVDGKIDDKEIPSVLVGVYVRSADAAFAICDLDKTLVKSGFERVVIGAAEPFDHAADVLWRLVREKNMSILYLTHRPDLFSASSKDWLRKYKFPPGTLYTSTLGSMLKGSGEFKSEEIARLKERFPNLRMAFGDKYSDMTAYIQNDIRSVLIPDIRWDKSKLDYWREQLQEMKQVKSDVAVCSNWFEIEEAVFGDKTFPPSRMIDKIRQTMRDLGG